jgi:hypothetical protein
MTFKKRLLTYALAIATSILRPPFAEAQMSAESEPRDTERQYSFSPVTISGFGSPLTASYKRLQRGVISFHENSQLAPLALLKFSVSDPEQNSTPLILRLELNDDHWLPIDVDAKGDFVLPTITDPQMETAQIVANRRKGVARIEPRVTSPGLEEGARRLGDIRLTCSVRWAIYGNDAPLALRAMTALTDGPCNNRFIRMYLIPQSNEKLKKFTLQEGSRKFDLVEDVMQRGLVIPLHDQSWTNEALVVSKLNLE